LAIFEKNMGRDANMRPTKRKSQDRETVRLRYKRHDRTEKEMPEESTPAN
jgi:hypothetical protein